MAIIIHLPDSNRSITIDGYSSLEEVYRTAPTESLQKLATAHIFFRRIVALVDILNSDDCNAEEFMLDFKGLEEMDSESEIGTKIMQKIMSDAFEEKYGPLFENISQEICDIYGSGAAAVDEQQVAVGILSTEADGMAMQA